MPGTRTGVRGVHQSHNVPRGVVEEALDELDEVEAMKRGFADSFEKADLEKMLTSELVDLASKLGKGVSGTKADIIDRLAGV